MRKCIIVLCIMLSSCALTDKRQEEFKNPIFNEWLGDYDGDMWDTKLFPDRTYSTNGELELHQDCVLTENEMNYVALMCTHSYNDEYPLENNLKNRKYEYIIAQEQNHPTCVEIIDKSYNEYGNPSGREIYCINKKHAKMYEKKHKKL